MRIMRSMSDINNMPTINLTAAEAELVTGALRDGIALAQAEATRTENTRPKDDAARRKKYDRIAELIHQWARLEILLNKLEGR
jgi:hypothetical protein